MEQLSEDKVRAIVSIKDTNAGRFLIMWLSSLVRDDMQRLIQEDPNNVGAIGKHQGMLLRAQAILHILQADYVGDEEPN